MAENKSAELAVMEIIKDWWDKHMKTTLGMRTRSTQRVAKILQPGTRADMWLQVDKSMGISIQVKTCRGGGIIFQKSLGTETGQYCAFPTLRGKVDFAQR